MTPVVITGAGLVTAIAQTPAALHRALCRGDTGVGRVSTFTTSELPCQLGAAIAPENLDDEIAGRPTAAVDKAGWLALVAAQRTVASSDHGSTFDDEMGLVLGTMFSGART